MKTINYVLPFLNKLDFAGHLEGDDYEKLGSIKKVLTDQFQDVNSEKIMNMFNNVDDLYVLFITQAFQSVEIEGLTNILRDKIFLLVKEKMEDEQFFPLSMLSYILSRLKEIYFNNIIKNLKVYIKKWCIFIRRFILFLSTLPVTWKYL